MRYDESLHAGDGCLYMPDLHRLRLIDSASRVGWRTFTPQDVYWLESCASFSAFVNEHVQAWLTRYSEHESSSLKVCSPLVLSV